MKIVKYLSRILLSNRYHYYFLTLCPSFARKTVTVWYGVGANINFFIFEHIALLAMQVPVSVSDARLSAGTCRISIFDNFFLAVYPVRLKPRTIASGAEIPKRSRVD